MQNKKKLYNGLLISVIMLAIGCAQQEKRMSVPASEVSNSSSASKDSNKRNPFVVISFNKGSSSLSESDKMKIRQFTANTNNRDEIDEIKVLAWADKEYPVEGNVAKDSDIRLADERARNIERYLENSLNTEADVDKHNMAERPMLLSKYFKTEDYKIKSYVENNDEARGFLNKKDSKAIIMLEYED